MIDIFTTEDTERIEVSGRAGRIFTTEETRKHRGRAKPSVDTTVQPPLRVSTGVGDSRGSDGSDRRSQ
ncbi:MAG: hypothetical protein OXG84_16190 [Chloroflexi bacterium]|nr:hypothetical protein [Chloroflexota bacterium]